MKVTGLWMEEFENQIKYYSNINESAENSHALVILTDWEELIY